MIARLGQNLGLKLLSLGCSFALFLYVNKQHASEMVFQVPVTINHDPTTRVLDQAPARRMVRVTLSGPVERLKMVESELKAIIDLRGHGSGDYRAPVEVPLPPSARDEVQLVNWWPRVASVRIEGRAARRLPVQATFSVQPPAGLVLGDVTVEPLSVQLSGWESDVDEVKRVQAVVHSLGSGAAVDVVVPVRALDAQGVEVGEGVKLQPPTVRVQAPLERSIWYKPVYVSPTLGEIPPSVRLQQVSITPRRFTLRGSESAIGAAQFLETEPIPIPNLPGVVVREARVILPAGVTIVERPRVRLVIVLAEAGTS
jgi:YbbR domain-containing protein